eukprot:11495-Heterococcus_DN1.PRE.3
MGISKRILRKLSVYANAGSQYGDAVFSRTGTTREPNQALPIRAIKFTNRLHYFARPLAVCVASTRWCSESETLCSLCYECQTHVECLQSLQSNIGRLERIYTRQLRLSANDPAQAQFYRSCASCHTQLRRRHRLLW